MSQNQLHRVLNWCGTALASKARKPIPAEPPVLCPAHYEHWANMQHRWKQAIVGTSATCEFCQEDQFHWKRMTP